MALSTFKCDLLFDDGKMEYFRQLPGVKHFSLTPEENLYVEFFVVLINFRPGLEPFDKDCT